MDIVYFCAHWIFKSRSVLVFLLEDLLSNSTTLKMKISESYYFKTCSEDIHENEFS